MADDISKKITISVEAETDKLKENITELNKTLGDLLQKQKQLSDSGKDSTKAFKDMAGQIKATQAALEGHSKAADEHVKTLDKSKTSLAENKDKMAGLLSKYDELSRAEGDSSAKAKELNTQIGTLTNTITEQEEKLKKSREVFDVHKGTTEALTSSFNKLKGVSGTFGPSLEEAAKGFEALKTGLSVVKTGFTSVGGAIKATGFGLLVLLLDTLIEHFTKTTEGSKQLKGAISAIGKVMEIIKKGVNGLKKAFIDAVTHPVESIKALSNTIKENIINRFKAFSVILDGIIHLDFKKVGDGVIQSFTGVTNATDKISKAFSTVKKGLQGTVKEAVNAYKEGYKQAGKKVDDHKKKVLKANKKISESYKQVGESAKEANEAIDTVKPPGVAESHEDSTPPAPDVSKLLIQTQGTEDKIVAIKKTAIQQVEEYAKQSAGKIAADALNALNNSIKEQSAAKIAALQKDEAAELSNKSLTAAQKLAIEQKYKQKENAEKTKAFKEQQEVSIAEALINGAIAVTKAEAQTGVLGALVIPGIIASTAMQIATISAQKPPAYAKGGLHYTSDGRGGVLPGYSKTDNTNAYLRSGEGIVVSEAMRVPWARNLVSAINVGFGGRDFAISNPGRGYAVGGIFTDGGDSNRYYNQPVTDQKNLANTIAYQMINNFPPVYVDVKDINNQQNILAQTINRVNL